MERVVQLAYGHDAQTPYIHFWTILFARDDLGCHPVGGTNHGGTF